MRSSLVSTNSKEALRVADSLAKNSKTDINRIKSQILLSFVYQNTGAFSLAIDHALAADKLASLMGMADFETNSALVLASIYREIEILEESKKYIDRAKQSIKSVNDSTTYKQLQIQIIQEESIQLIKSKLYDDAIANMNVALETKGYIDVRNPESLLIRSKCLIILAECYAKMGNYAESLPYLKKILDEVYAVETLIKPFTYQLLAESYCNLGQLDSAKAFLDLELPYVYGSNNIELKKRYYSTEAQYFKAQGNDKLALGSLDNLNKIEQQYYNTVKIIGNNLVKNNIRDLKILRRNNLILIWILIIGTSVLFLYYFIKIKPKIISNLQKDKQLLANIDFTDLNQNSSNINKERPSNPDYQISLETETRLVKKLNDLEDDNFFLDKTITLGSLANKLMTNQKYVSFIIRKYKNQHFNDYMLNLRIQYIIRELESNKVMLDYKLSYLADIAGFTSHSKFTMAFKSVMNITPSQFIEELRNSKA